jgi:hypothetical protein
MCGECAEVSANHPMPQHYGQNGYDQGGLGVRGERTGTWSCRGGVCPITPLARHGRLGRAVRRVRVSPSRTRIQARAGSECNLAVSQAVWNEKLAHMAGRDEAERVSKIVGLTGASPCPSPFWVCVPASCRQLFRNLPGKTQVLIEHRTGMKFLLLRRPAPLVR